jgi:hypothetical protein
MSALAKETEYYKKLLPSLLINEGKFAVIHGDKLIGTYDSYEDALKIGYKECGINPFLVKKIAAEENISYFTRDLDMSCLA